MGLITFNQNINSINFCTFDKPLAKQLQNEHNNRYIKNMVCPRCIDAVQEIYNDLNISVKHIQLGKVECNSEINEKTKTNLSVLLAAKGFELLQDKKHKIIEQIKALIINQIHHANTPLTKSLSKFLADNLHQEYTSLSRLFSSVEGITIEKYVLKQKVERVKELLFYKEYTLSEIAFQMSYSSVAHLSAQFKKETGMSPTEFKKLKEPKHRSLDSI